MFEAGKTWVAMVPRLRQECCGVWVAVFNYSVCHCVATGLQGESKLPKVGCSGRKQAFLLEASLFKKNATFHLHVQVFRSLVWLVVSAQP